MSTEGHGLKMSFSSGYFSIDSEPQTITGQNGDDPIREGPYIIPAHASWDGCWELATDLTVSVQASREEVLANTHMTVQEYGVGSTLDEAIQDLLTSLSDYRESLEAREKTLGKEALKDLGQLRALIRRIPDR